MIKTFYIIDTVNYRDLAVESVRSLFKDDELKTLLDITFLYPGESLPPDFALAGEPGVTDQVYSEDCIPEEAKRMQQVIYSHNTETYTAHHLAGSEKTTPWHRYHFLQNGFDLYIDCDLFFVRPEVFRQCLFKATSKGLYMFPEIFITAHKKPKWLKKMESPKPYFSTAIILNNGGSRVIQRFLQTMERLYFKHFRTMKFALDQGLLNLFNMQSIQTLIHPLQLSIAYIVPEKDVTPDTIIHEDPGKEIDIIHLIGDKKKWDRVTQMEKLSKLGTN
jgi:hypothetical protein